MRRLDDRGTLSIEYALILPAFLTLTLGVMDLGRLMWTQVTLDRAVQAAARCASVNSSACTTDAAVQAYAAGQAWGLTTQASNFTVTHPSCGVSVTAQLAFAFVMPWPTTGVSSVSASACYPQLSSGS